MMIEPKRYSSGRVAIINLFASISALELRRGAGLASYEELVGLSDLLFLRGDLLARIADHENADSIAREVIERQPGTESALFLGARLANRFHRFEEAGGLLLQALAAGCPAAKVDGELASLLQAKGQYHDALALRERLAKENPGIHSIGALATLLAEMDQWPGAEDLYRQALVADSGVSPIPCAQLLFEWGVSAMRRGALDRAEQVLSELAAILPAHAPGRGHRAEVALARGDLDLAARLVAPLLDVTDDPEYRATNAEILAAKGDRMAIFEARRAAAAYEKLLARRPAAYADHAAAFFLGVGDDPLRAVQLALANWRLRDTPRSRKLLAKARQKIQAQSLPERAA